MSSAPVHDSPGVHTVLLNPRVANYTVRTGEREVDLEYRVAKSTYHCLGNGRTGYVFHAKRSAQARPRSPPNSVICALGTGT
jgi:hypothetical protein